MAKPGRRPLDPSSQTPSASVHLKLPAKDYDRLDRLRHRGESLQELIRRELQQRIHSTAKPAI